MTTSARISARRVVGAVKACGITHIVWLPDSETGFMYQALASEPGITLVPICREGESLAIALGLWMGGKEPMVLIQSTGFFESGDAVRGVGLDLRQPLLMMIGYRGYSPNGNPTDSAAVFLEPMLKAWGITYHLLRTEGDLGCIVKAHREAHQRERPVAVLVCGEYT